MWIVLRKSLPLLLALLLVALAPSLGLAAGGDHGHKEGLAGGKGAFIDIHRYDLGIYTLVVFGLLFAILAKFAWGPFTQLLQQREAGLLALHNQAAADRAAAADLMAKAKAELDATAGKVRELLEEARRDAEALRAAKAEEGAKDAQAERERAKREAEQERATLAKDIQQQAVELAVLIATKALRQQVSMENQSRLLDESIAELKANSRA